MRYGRDIPVADTRPAQMANEVSTSLAMNGLALIDNNDMPLSSQDY